MQRFGVPQTKIDSVLAPGKEEEKKQGVFRFGVDPAELKTPVNGDGEQIQESIPGEGASIDTVIADQAAQQTIDQDYENSKITSTPDQDLPITETEGKSSDLSNDLLNKTPDQLMDDEINTLTDDEEFNVWYQGWQNQINEHYKNRDIRGEDGSLFQMGGPDNKMAPYPSEPNNMIKAYDYKAAYKDGVEPSLQKHKDGRHFWHWPSKYKDKDHPNRYVSTDSYLNAYAPGMLGDQKIPTKIKKMLYDIHQETGGKMDETERNTVAYKWLQANGVDPKTYDPNYKAPVGYKTSEYAAAVRKWRPVNRDNTLLDDYTPEMEEESSVLLEQMDNYVYPTLFPINPDAATPDPSTWTEKSGNEAFQEAKLRGEVLEFRNEQEAMAFAESKGSGDWKSVPEEPDPQMDLTIGKPVEYKSAFAEKILAYDSLQEKWVVDPNVGYDDFQAPSMKTGYYDSKEQKWMNPEITRNLPDGWDRRTSNMTHDEHKKAIDIYDNVDKDMYIPFKEEIVNIPLQPPDVAGKQYELSSADDYKQYYYATAIKALSEYYELPEVYFDQEDVDAYAAAKSLSVGQATVAAINSTLSSVSVGITENLWDPTPNQDVIAKHKQMLPYSKEGQGWPKIQRSLFAVGHTGAEVSAYLGPTKALGLLKLKNVPVGYAAMMRSAAVFGSVGGGRRVFDPDEREHMTLSKWLVGTTLDTALGSAFPFMGRLGGEVLKTPNTYRAFANYMAQSTALTGGMTAVGFADGLAAYMMENPNQTFTEAFKTVGEGVVDPEMLFQSFMTMSILHGLGAGPRFFKGGKLKAEELAKLEKVVGLMWEDAPFDIKKKPNTVPEMVEYQEKYNLWVESRGNKAEYQIENGKRIEHNEKRDALNEKRLMDRDYYQQELDAMDWKDVFEWANARQQDYFRHKGMLYKVELKYPRPVIKTLEEGVAHSQWIAKEKQKVQMEMDQFEKSGRVNKNLLGDKTVEQYESGLKDKMEKLNIMESDVGAVIRKAADVELDGGKARKGDPDKVVIQEDILKSGLEDAVEPPKEITSKEITEGKGLGDNSITILESMFNKQEAFTNEQAQTASILEGHIKEKFDAMAEGKPQLLKMIQDSKLPDGTKKRILGEWYDVRVEKAAGQKMAEDPGREKQIEGFVKKEGKITEDSVEWQDHKSKDGKRTIAQYTEIGDSPTGKIYIRRNPDGTYRVSKFVEKADGPVLYSMGDKVHKDFNSALKSAEMEVSSSKPDVPNKTWTGDEYKQTHRPREDGPTASDLTGKDSFAPDDIYENPQHYIGVTPKDPAYKETIDAFQAMRNAKGNPDAMITVYRTGPKNELNDGDWITLSESYAKQHSKHPTDPEQDMPVHKFEVRAGDMKWSGEVLEEWGYFPDIIKPGVKNPGARRKLIKEFDAGKRQLWELTMDERGLTQLGEDALTKNVPELSKLDKEHKQSVLDALGRGEDVRPEVLESFGITNTGRSKPPGDPESEPVVPVQQPGKVSKFRKEKDPEKRYEILRKGRVQTLNDIAGAKLSKTDNAVFEGTHKQITLVESKDDPSVVSVLFNGSKEPQNKAQRDWVAKNMPMKGRDFIQQKIIGEQKGWVLSERGNKLYDQGQINKAVKSGGMTQSEYDTQVKPTRPKSYRGSQVVVLDKDQSRVKDTDLYRVKQKGGTFKNISDGRYVIYDSKGNKPLNDALNKLGEGGNDIGPFKNSKALDNIQPSRNNELGNDGVIVGYSRGAGGHGESSTKDYTAWLSDGLNAVSVDAKYIDMFQKFFGPDLTYKFSKTNPNISAVTIFDSKGKEIGMVMPIRNDKADAPPNIQGYLGAKQSEKANNNPFLAKGGSGKGGLGSKKFTREDKQGSANDQFEMADLNDPIKRADIGNDLIRNLSLNKGENVRFKRIKNFAKNAVAIFFPKSEIIRVNSLKDVDDLSHEIGHYLDISLFGISESMRVKGHDQLAIQVKKWRNMKQGTSKDTKMKVLVNKYGQEAVDRWEERLEVQDELISFLQKRFYPELTVKEGIAEFVSDYVTNPKNAAKEAPKFFEMFEGIIKDTPVQKALVQARDQMKDWDALDPRVQIESTIHRKGEEGWLEGIVKEVYGDAYFNLVDFTQPLRRVTDNFMADNPGAKGHELVINQFLSNLGTEGKAQQFLDNHPFRITNGEITIREDIPGLMKILQPFIAGGGTKIKALEGYLVAQRNIELHTRYKGQAATLGLEKSRQVRELYEKDFPELKEAAEQIYEYQDAVLDYYKDSGMLSELDVDNIRQLNKFYIPFNRYLHGEEMYKVGSPGGKYSLDKFLNDKSYQKVRGIKGAKEDVMPPLEQIIANTFQLISAADMNRTKVTLVNNLLLTGSGSGVQKIPNSKLFVTEQKDPNTGEVINRIYQHRKVPIEGPGIISMRVNGEIGYYEVTPDVYKAFQHLNTTTSKYLKVAALPSTILRKGAVEYNPLFGLRNVPRDIGSSIFYTKHGYNPFHFITGAKSYNANDIVFQKFLASGSAQSYLVGIDKHLDVGKNSMYAHPAYQAIDGWRPNGLNPFKQFKKFNSFTETANRVGGFANALNKTGDVYLAMAEGRSIAADYGLRGASMRNAGALWPFLNARIQHTKQFGIAHKPENLAKTITKGAIYYGAPTIANWMYWHSSEELADRYADMPTWRKYGFFNIPIPGSQYTFSLPTGGFGYVYGKAPETFLNYLNDPNFGYREILESLASGWEQIMPVGGGGGFATEILPYPAQLIAENVVGHDFFTGRRVIPREMEHLDKSLQYDENTPIQLRWIADKIGMSPKRLQHFVSSTFAGTGDFAMDVVDDLAVATGLSDHRYATWTKLSDYPFMRAFVSRMPYRGKQGLTYQKMWENLDGLQTIDNTVNKWISLDNRDAGGVKERIDNLSSGEVPKQLDKYLSKGDNMQKYQWMHTEFDSGYPDLQGNPKYTTNMKQINKFHDVVKMIGDINILAMKEKGYMTDQPMAADFKRLWKNMSKEEQAEYRGNEKLLSGQDIVFHNNLIITDITKQLYNAMESGDNFVLDQSLMLTDDLIKKYLVDFPLKFGKKNIKEKILQK
jgi:hypothetical protein